jgi:hypothetical protein
MKHKLFALILALTVASWAQTSTQTAPSVQQQSTDKAQCFCRDKMASADSKDAKMCARHGKHAKGSKDCCSGKEASSCCGKDGKSCMKDGNAPASCCKDCNKDKTASSCCGKDCKDSCCKKQTEAATNCCSHASHS